MLDRASIRNILLIRLSAVGDVINTLPALAALRASFPDARIAFIAEDKAGDVIVGHPDLDEAIIYPRRRWQRMLVNPLKWPWLVVELIRYVRRIRRGRFDVALDFQGNLKGGVHSRCSGAPLRIGFVKSHSKEFNHWFSTVRVEPASARMNRVEKFLCLLNPLGVNVSRAEYHLPASPESEFKVGAYLKGAGLGQGGYVLIHPGTSAFGMAKRWPLDRFAGLADEIEKQLKAKVLIAWGPGERPMAVEIAGSCRATVAMETRSLLDLAELIRRSRLFIGADSGPLHLASAVGVPSVALFGPKDPLIYAPYNRRHRVVFKPDGDGVGRMEAITVADAFEAVKALA